VVVKISEKAGLKYLASMLSANLILQSVKRLDDSFEKIAEVGAELGKMGDVDIEFMIKAISYTAGNQKANLQLVKYINLYLDAKHKKYPYEPLVQKRRKQILTAYNIANSTHHSDWEKLIQESIVKAIGKNAVFDSAQVIPKEIMKQLGYIQNLQKEGEEP